MRTIALGLVTAAFLTASSSANDWKPAELPSAVQQFDFSAIGSDGLLYEMTSNPNGYVLTSLIHKYRFAPTGRFTGDILAGQAVIYLGASCDAEGDGLKGKWTRDGTGLNFAIDDGNGVVRSFRLLEDGLSPNHAC